ncbi:MAG: hypothetical protein R2704_12285 [Microthrixaceae bacterium]
MTWSPALGQGDVLNVNASYSVSVAVGGAGARKVELVAERSPAGSPDWSHPSNLQPYFSQIVVTSGATVTFSITPGSFQAGYQYRLRARQWFDGDGTNMSAFSNWTGVQASAPTNKPVFPYPLSPKGQLGRSGIILRSDDSALPGSSGAPVSAYEYEIKTAHDPFEASDTISRWIAAGPAPASGVAEMPVTDCQNLPGCTGNGVFPDDPGMQFRWRVRAKDTAGVSGDWSRWRYFDTASRQAEYSYIPNRAGSYFAGPDGGDEMSGLVASRQYPGIYWGVRDAGGTEDRAALYALRLDDDGRLGNVDGYVTKEIPVTGAENIDWESIVADDSGNLWIGDTGDFYRNDAPDASPEDAAGRLHDRNNSPDPDVRLFRVPEPNPDVDDVATVTKTAYFAYPDGTTYDAEAMFWLDGYIFLVTKHAPQQVFRFPGYLSGSSVNQLRPVGTLGTNLEPVTDAAVSDDNTELALSTAPKRVVVYSGEPTHGRVQPGRQVHRSDLLVEQDPSGTTTTATPRRSRRTERWPRNVPTPGRAGNCSRPACRLRVWPSSPPRTAWPWCRSTASTCCRCRRSARTATTGGCSASATRVPSAVAASSPIRLRPERSSPPVPPGSSATTGSGRPGSRTRASTTRAGPTARPSWASATATRRPRSGNPAPTTSPTTSGGGSR